MKSCSRFSIDVAQHVGDAGRAHLRHEIVRRDLLARHEQPVLARKRRLDAAVEEVRHVRVLLRLGRAEHASCPRWTPLRRRCSPSTAAGRRRAASKRPVVRRHRRDRELRASATSKPSNVGSVSAAHDLPHPIRAIVEADHRRRRRASARPGLPSVDDHRRRDELVGLVALVRRANHRRADRCPSGPTPSTATRYHFSIRSQRLSRSMPK